MNEKRTRGFGGLTMMMLVFALFVGFLYMNRQIDQREQEMTYSEFTSLVEEGKVENVVIAQNKNVPTGSLEVEIADGDGDSAEIREFYVSDVNEVQKYLQEEEVDYVIEDVPQDSWFATTILPTLVMLAGIVFYFS